MNVLVCAKKLSIEWPDEPRLSLTSTFLAALISRAFSHLLSGPFSLGSSSILFRCRPVLAPAQISGIKTCLAHFKLRPSCFGEHMCQTPGSHGSRLSCAAPGAASYEAISVVEEVHPLWPALRQLSSCFRALLTWQDPLVLR